MEKIAICDFIRENEIEEKIPYFGKARLYTIPLSSSNETRSFPIPREIFHFVTALYVLQPTISCDMTLRINSYEKSISPDSYSEMNPDTHQRTNLLNEPIFLGNHIQMVLKVKPLDTFESVSVVHVLVEYSKILPSLFIELHTNHTVLVSKQNDQEILIYRGNAP